MIDDFYDVIVVGARVAGASTAMLLARSGAKVLLVDRQPPGQDTISTHAFMRAGVHLLSRWGVMRSLLDAGTPVISTTTFHYGAQAIAIPLRTDATVPGLIAPRRSLLDRTLSEQASRDGADVHYNTAMRELLADRHGRVVGAVIVDKHDRVYRARADLVIGADGVGSSVARLSGAAVLRRSPHSTTTLLAYLPGIENTGFHWLYGRDEAAGIIPTNDGATCVFVSIPTRTFDGSSRQDPGRAYREALTRLVPQLRVPANLPLAGVFRGREGHLRDAGGEGWALVGDAGFYRDPLTAHGMTDALRDAAFAVRAILDGTDAGLRTYQQLRDAIAVPLLEVTDRIVSFEWTFDGLQAEHRALNALMKAELAEIERLPIEEHGAWISPGEMPNGVDSSARSTIGRRPQ